MSDLSTPLSQVLRTTKKHLERMEFLGLKTVRDFLTHFPRTYEDRSTFTPITQAKINEKQTFRGHLSSINHRKTRNGRLLISALLTDKNGSLEINWFNRPYLLQVLKPDMDIIVSGKIQVRNGRLTLANPDFELVKEEQLHTARIIPIYHETEGITSKWIREKMQLLWHFTENLTEHLPESVLREEKLMGYREAMREVHFPTDFSRLALARHRLAFDELFEIQLRVFERKRQWTSGFGQFEKQIHADPTELKKLASHITFAFTNAQKRALKEILMDLKRDCPMLRLLQGDVGSGKTIVAAVAAFCAIRSGFQSIFMAPTEVLARQHYKDLSNLFEPLGIKTALLIGSLKTSEKNDIKKRLANGELDLTIGTHALISEGIFFKNLGFAVIDEQHRFGVAQREDLQKHGFPHLLNMSATPIPRTLAMTIYGDQDLSIIDEMPPGRQKIVTRVVPEEKRPDVYRWIAKKVEEGRQVFVICPLIDESDALEIKSAVKEYEYLSTEIFPNLRLGLLHGRLSGNKKTQIMSKFSTGKLNILVSTSVVEVGVNVPNATIMVIEGAERFGLAQLHQFRGRVGRGEQKSYCFIFEGKASEKNAMNVFFPPTRDKIRERLSALERHHDGFKLAEIDMEIRGPGEIYGVRQSGIPDLKMASLTDRELLLRARAQAEKNFAYFFEKQAVQDVLKRKSQ
ncbi:ATP-dependent DNA helicase RecG [Candidatus Peregrinibacteria bacterium]|nr:ATP-dependent DNA helicase RecG [Candidatus Peregrinibacteria bacterium]